MTSFRCFVSFFISFGSHQYLMKIRVGFSLPFNDELYVKVPVLVIPITSYESGTGGLVLSALLQLQ